MMHATSASFTPPDKIFIGRIQEQDMFRDLLGRWKRAIAVDAGETLSESPSPNQRISGLIVHLYGRGGIGKSTLLRRFHQTALTQFQHVDITIPSPIDWEFAVGDNRSFLNPLPGSQVDATLYFGLLYEHIRRRLGRKDDDFRDYNAALHEIYKVREQVQQTLTSLKQDEHFSWLPKLLSEEMVAVIGMFVPPAAPLLNNDVVKDGITRGLTFTAAQSEQLRTKLQEKLGKKSTYYFDSHTHLGLAMGRDLARMAKNIPILFFFDTYEEIDEGDKYLRLVMGAAGARVGWVIAGRDDLWSGLEQQKRYIEQVYGYKDIVQPSRSLSLDFNSGSIGVFTLNEVIEYFTRFQQEVPELSSQPPLEESEAQALLDVTLGVPLAINIAAGLYQETKDLSVIIQERDKQLKVVHTMVQRYLLHTRADIQDRIKLYGLAMLRRPEDSNALATALGLPQEQLAYNYEPELKRLQRRYSFIFSDKEQPSLHKEVRHFMRLELYERRKEPDIQMINTRLMESHEKALQQREENYHYETLRQRFDGDETWIGLYLDLTEQLFWKEPAEGVCAALFFMFAASVYNRTANQEVKALGKFFEPYLTKQYKEWWYFAVQSLLHEYSYSLSIQEKKYLLSLEREMSRRPPRFPIVLSKDYKQEVIATLWWRVGEAYVREEDRQALKWYEKALTILPNETELKETMADTAVDIAYQVEEDKQYEESLALLQQALAWNPHSAWAYAVQGNVLYDSGKYQEAITACNMAIELDISLDLAYTIRGNSNAALKRFEQALVDHTHAINLLPQKSNTQHDIHLSTTRERKSEQLNSSPQQKTVFALPESAQRRETLQEQLYSSKDDVLPRRHLHDQMQRQRSNILAYQSRGAIFAAMQNYDQALADLDQAIMLDPDNADAYYHRGLVYYDKDDYDKAIEDYTHALTIESSSMIYTKRGQANRLLENNEQAFADFDQALALDSQGAMAYAERAETHRLLEHYEQALADFDQALALDPQFAWACGSRGQVHASLEHYEQALADFDQALMLNPQLAWVYTERAETHQLLEHYEQALADFDQVLTLNPQDAWAYANRGNAHRMLNHYEQALADFDQALTLNPQDAWVYAERAETHRLLEHYEQALADFDQALILDANDMWTYINRGWLFIKLDEYEKADKDFNQAIAVSPDDAGGYLGQGYVHLHLRNKIKALDDFHHAHQLDKTDVNLAWMIIFTSFSKERPKATNAYQLREIAAIDSPAPETAICRGVAEGLLGHFPEALAEIEKVLTFSKQDASFWYGMLLAYQQNISQAREWISRAVEEGLPPILLTPLYWLEKDRPEVFRAVALPILSHYNV